MLQRNVLDAAHGIVTVPGVLSPEECSAMIALAEQVGFVDAPVTTGRGFVMMPELRNNTRVILDDVVRAAALWRTLAAAVPERRAGYRAVGLNERFRIYRYEPGQYFEWHRDGAFIRSTTERSLVTVLVYLNADCSGGETEFDDGPQVTPRAGMALLFDHPVRHRGAPVTRGRKYVLRTDVMFVRPPS
jgi:prolyl 4-hydroxylase